MVRAQLSPGIAKPLLHEALADHGAPPWPCGLPPGGATDLDLTAPGSSPPSSSGKASSQEEVLPPGRVVGATRLSQRGAQQTRLPSRTDRAQKSRMKPAVVIPADLEAARVTALSGGGLSGCTTVRLKNVEPSLMPATTIAALNANGFEGMFDFVHVPMDMKRMKNRGILFINLIDPATADAMYQSFHHQTMPGVSLAGKTLEITPAYVQGFKENFDLHVESEAPFLECFRCVL